MQKIAKNILSLSAALLIGVSAVSAGAFPYLESTSAEADYYAPITAAEGSALLGQLHDLITTTHTHYSSYSECRDYAHTTDFAAGAEKSVIEFYTHETILYYINDLSTSGGQGTWNREHVWPKSLSGGLWGTDGAGADLHHIRPSEVKMNSQRGNDKFGEVNGGGEVYSKTTDGKNSQLGGYHAGGVFEPLDNVKGDAARIVLYVYTHYNTYANVNGSTDGNGTSSCFGTLHFTNIMSASSEEAAVELLLAWNKLDPVDEIERTRNEAAYEIQGNRNPFIDHPEYAEMIWGNAEIGGGEDTSRFHRAVSELRESGTLKEQLAAINEAIRAYQALTEQGRDAAAEDVAKLQAAISAYNETVRAQNAEAVAAEGGALGAVAGGGRS